MISNLAQTGAVMEYQSSSSNQNVFVAGDSEHGNKSVTGNH